VRHDERSLDEATYATPGHLVRRASQLHSRIFDEEFGDRITARQFAVMLAIARRPGIDQITLSSVVAVDRSTIGDMISRLSARGYVADERNGRRKLLRLTAAGRDLIAELVPLIDRVTERLLAPLDAQERTTLLELLAKVVAVDDPAFPNYQLYVADALR
jgi:DNA-binding MarR family transcriptional regulator